MAHTFVIRHVIDTWTAAPQAPLDPGVYAITAGWADVAACRSRWAATELFESDLARALFVEEFGEEPDVSAPP